MIFMITVAMVISWPQIFDVPPAAPSDFPINPPAATRHLMHVLWGEVTPAISLQSFENMRGGFLIVEGGICENRQGSWAFQVKT